MLESAVALIKRSEKALCYDISLLVKHISHWLPTQGPIEDFIHHNTLHNFQDRPFHDGVAVASRIYGSFDYLTIDEFRRLYKEGKITDAAIQKSLDRFNIPKSEHSVWKQRLLEEKVFQKRPAGIANAGIRKAWVDSLQIDLNNLAHPVLFRLLGGFLDQGISLWQMPNAAELSFWQCVGALARESLLPLRPLNDPECQEVLTKEPEEAIAYCLERLVGDPALYEQYGLEMLLAHPGWAAMVVMVEENPLSLHAPRKITVSDLMAVDLVLELGWLKKKIGKDFKQVKDLQLASPVSPSKMEPVITPAVKLARVWQEAFEWTYYQDVLNALENFHTEERKEPEKPFAQAYFCIDDRESGIRRYLEEIDPEVQTLATAGFFGLDWYFQAAGSRFPVQHCPAPVKPQHLVKEVVEHYAPHSNLSEIFNVTPTHNTLFRGLLLTQTLGIGASIRLFFNVFRPGFTLLTSRKMTTVKSPTHLQIIREGNEKSPEGYWLGYSIPELVERVYNVFKNSGLTENFSELIVVVGHGSSSANNPHFAAYDCGACSGKPGAPNARAFAWIANHPAVREGLKAKGMHLPPDTHVLGGLHDTTRDEITYFDLLSLPAKHQAAFKRFNAAMKKALEKNAKERCRRFALVRPDISPSKAHAHVQERSKSIFEPRPEMNHATNTLAIVGRRSMTRGLFMDRRVFLNSYDPTRDSQGEILTGILNAVIPVCGGINLEYFFSRVDPIAYGAGTKLPHNVVGLVGVANGVEGDLQIGLPTQMTEIHDPIRLMIIVEQEPEIALKAVKKNPANFEWVENEWIYYVCFSPSTKKAHVLEKGEWKPFASEPGYVLPEAPDGNSIIDGKSGNIRVHKVGVK